MGEVTRQRFLFAPTLMAIVALLNLTACGKSEPSETLLNQPPGLYAWFDTNHGEMIARLFPDNAPITVANMTGLANGEQPFYNYAKKKIEKGHYYDGTIFHRVVKNFVVQGGDPHGTGAGNPGYFFKDESSPDLKFDRAGLLAMANSGPNTNSSQFFFTLKPEPNLDGRHTIFGEVVSGMETVESIANTPITRFIADRPLRDVKLKKLRVYAVGADGKVELAKMPQIEGLPIPEDPPNLRPLAQ